MNGTNTRQGLSCKEAGYLGYLNSKEKCQRAFQKRIDDYLLNVNYCSFCRKPLSYQDRKKRFCNSSCSASYFNNKRKKIKYCLNCQQPIIGYTDSLYCNRRCFKNHRKIKNEEIFKEYLQKWKQGLEKGWTGKGYQIDVRIKRFLRKKYENKCQQCSWGEIHPITKKVPLQVDHIDGDASNCKEENLRLLCPNCHSLTPTFGRLNKKTCRTHR